MVQDHDCAVERLLADHENVTRRAVERARAYHASYPEEIGEAIADNRRPLSELRELYPFVELVPADAGGQPVRALIDAHVGAGPVRARLEAAFVACSVEADWVDRVALLARAG